jgi:exodeoxyribonuclease VII small subunit
MAREKVKRGPDESGHEHDGTDLEARLRRLEEILARMESDDVSLEEALRLFEEGVGHVREAEKVLSEAELRVEELLADGHIRPLEVEEE